MGWPAILLHRRIHSRRDPSGISTTRGSKRTVTARSTISSSGSAGRVTRGWTGSCAGILKEKGLRDEDPFEDMDHPVPAGRSGRRKVDFDRVVAVAAEKLSPRVGLSIGEINDRFMQETGAGRYAGRRMA